MLTIATFYRFFRLDNPTRMKADLEDLFATSDLFGTILLANEGINGTVCGSHQNIRRLKAYFADDPRLRDIEYKESFSQKNPFIRRKIKIKNEIVTMGKSDIDLTAVTPRYVDARQWDQLLDDPSTFVIDVRNHYETALGKFDGSHDPQLENFRQFPEFVKTSLNPAIHQRIAMSCTGGIRCEKASAYLASCGFLEIYQLKGGILQYLQDTKKSHSRWRGECFVFDYRVTVDHDLQPGSYTLCFSCRTPLSAHDKTSHDYIEAVACSHCRHTVAKDKQHGKSVRHRQMHLAHTRGRHHLGPDAMTKKLNAY